MNEMNKRNDDSWIEFCTIKIKVYIIRLIIITSYTRLGLLGEREVNAWNPKHNTKHKYIAMFKCNSNNRWERPTITTPTTTIKTLCNEMITALKRHINSKPTPAIWTISAMAKRNSENNTKYFIYLINAFLFCSHFFLTFSSLFFGIGFCSVHSFRLAHTSHTLHMDVRSIG